MYPEIVLANQSQPTTLALLIWNDCSECRGYTLKLWDIPGLNSDELYPEVDDLKTSTASERSSLAYSFCSVHIRSVSWYFFLSASRECPPMGRLVACKDPGAGVHVSAALFCFLLNLMTNAGLVYDDPIPNLNSC